MATIERNGLLTYLDGSGNKNLLYPITKAECVYGLEAAIYNHTHTAPDVGAVPLDGSASMTGSLTVPNMVSVSKASIMEWGLGEAAFRIKDRNSNTERYIGIKDNTAAPDFNSALLYVEYDGATKYNTQTILHTGNKRYGTYTGNGAATSRTIDVGGVGDALLINGYGGLAIVTANGAIGRDGTNAFVVNGNEAKFLSGKLTLVTTNPVLNYNGHEIGYRVL